MVSTSVQIRATHINTYLSIIICLTSFQHVFLKSQSEGEAAFIVLWRCVMIHYTGCEQPLILHWGMKTYFWFPFLLKSHINKEQNTREPRVLHNYAPHCADFMVVFTTRRVCVFCQQREMRGSITFKIVPSYRTQGSSCEVTPLPPLTSSSSSSAPYCWSRAPDLVTNRSPGY